MRYSSIIAQRGTVGFPAFTSERVYMREFRKADGLPEDLKRWQPTVDQMLDGIDTDGPVYLMVDQGFVKAGTSHRRPGLHIDGYWHPGISAHAPRGRHRPDPEPLHRSEPLHSPHPPSHMAGKHGWKHATFETPEAIILAASVHGAEGYVGEFETEIGEGGDCSHLDVSGLDRVVMEAARVYAGNVTALHQSLPIRNDALRTLVRLNVPGWSPQ